MLAHTFGGRVELIDYVRMLRRRWTWVVAFTLLGLAGGLLYVLNTTRTYEATTELFVASVASANGAASSSSSSQSAAQFTLSRMKSYATLVDTPGVARGVIDELGLRMTTQQLASRVSASVPTQTVVIQVTATDGNPGTAAAIANATGARLGLAIEDIERVPNGGKSPVQVTTTLPANPPGAPASPNRALALVLGLIAGLGLGLLAASLSEQAGSRRRGVTSAPDDDERAGAQIPDERERDEPVPVGERVRARSRLLRDSS